MISQSLTQIKKVDRIVTFSPLNRKTRQNMSFSDVFFVVICVLGEVYSLKKGKIHYKKVTDKSNRRTAECGGKTLYAVFLLFLCFFIFLYFFSVELYVLRCVSDHHIRIEVDKPAGNIRNNILFILAYFCVCCR